MRPWGSGLRVPLILEQTARNVRGNRPHPRDRKTDMDGHLDDQAAGWLVFSELLGLRRLLVRTEVRREGRLTMGSTG